MRGAVCIFYSLLLICCTGRAEKGTVTLGSLLEEITDIDRMTRWPAVEYRAMQQSSYDRSSVSPDEPGWFANNDGFGFIRVEQIDGRTEKVLFEDDGPGAITRIWMTTHNFSGTMRFYFDGADEPAWIVPAYDLASFGISALGRGLLQPHTSYIPGVMGGGNLYLPIPYADGCRVTFEQPPGSEDVPHYYHFNYRKYPEGTRVETFGIDAVEKYKRQLVHTDRSLLEPPAATSYQTASAGVVAPGDTLLVALPGGARMITEVVLEIEPGAEYEAVMRQLVFAARFDGKTTVWAPVSDLSGAGMGAPETYAWLSECDGNGRIVCRWPMPYRKEGSLGIINYAPYECSISVSVAHRKYKWDDRSLYFHASWKQENGLPFYKNSEDCYDWNFTTLTGRGLYRGDVLSLFNHSRAWYGEGDEKIWVDGESFPSHFSTGTEDYYNSSWAPVVPFHTPFGGAPREDLENSQGYNTFWRTRHLDGIPFRESLRFDIEMLGWVDGTVDYSTTVFWYGEHSARVKDAADAEQLRYTLPERPADPAKFKRENAIEFEKLNFTDKSRSLMVDRQNMAGFPGGQWSERTQLVAFGGEPGDYIEFTVGDLSGKSYDLSIYSTEAADYAIIEFSVNGRRVTVWDCYSEEVKDSGEISLGAVSPVGGTIKIKVKITGKNPLSSGYMFGLDCLTLTEKPGR